MGPLLFHGTASNGKKLDTNHISALTCCDSGIVKMNFFLDQKVFMEDAMVEVMVFEGRGRGFVDQLTRIFERQLFFLNLFQSFQPRNKKAPHLQNMWNDFANLILRQNQKNTNLHNKKCAHACNS